MKKKILSFVLAILLIVPAMFMLSACDQSVPSHADSVSTYNELVSALNGNKQIINLKNDISVTETLVVNRNVTLNMNGKTISCANEIYNGNNWSVISVRENGNLTVKGNGKIHTIENDSYVFDVMDGGKLTIEDGEYVGNISAVYAYDGVVNIKGGRYSIQQLNDNKVEGPYGLTINIYNNNKEPFVPQKATISITGGEFVNFDPTDKTDNKADDLVAEGYVAELVEGETKVYRIVKAK